MFRVKLSFISSFLCLPSLISSISSRNRHDPWKTETFDLATDLFLLWEQHRRWLWKGAYSDLLWKRYSWDIRWHGCRFSRWWEVEFCFWESSQVPSLSRAYPETSIDQGIKIDIEMINVGILLIFIAYFHSDLGITVSEPANSCILYHL